MIKQATFLLMLTVLGLSGCGKSSQGGDEGGGPAPLEPSAQVSCTATRTCSVKLWWDYDPAELEQISGFKIYHGPVSNSDPNFQGYSTTIISDKTLEATVTDLGADPVVYFVVTAFVDNGESPWSNEISINFSDPTAPSVRTIQAQP